MFWVISSSGTFPCRRCLLGPAWSTTFGQSEQDRSTSRISAVPSEFDVFQYLKGRIRGQSKGLPENYGWSVT